MRQSASLAALAALLLASPSIGQEAARQLEAHVHGEGALNMAIEGGTVAIDLDVPAMDIVGFEFRPVTTEHHAAIEAGVARLADPLALFVPPPDAGCIVVEATVEHVFSEPEPMAVDMEGHDHGAMGGHSAFEALYALTCTNPEALTGLHFAYFSAFPDAEHVAVQVISDTRGQGAFEVERGAPHLDLSALN